MTPLKSFADWARGLDDWAAKRGLLRQGDTTPITIRQAIAEGFRPPVLWVLLAGWTVAAVLGALGAKGIDVLVGIFTAGVFTYAGDRARRRVDDSSDRLDEPTGPPVV